MNEGFFNFLFLGFLKDDIDSIRKRKEELRELFTDANTITILLYHMGGMPGWYSLSEGGVFDKLTTDISNFDDYDYSSYHILFKWIEKFILEISTDIGSAEILVGAYSGSFMKYICEYDYRQLMSCPINTENDELYENILNFRMPSLYGKMKQNLKQALAMNVTLLTGMLKDAGYYIPVKIVDSFCSMERDSIFFQKKHRNHYVRDSDIESLSKAASLYEKGLLSEQEFKQLKRKLLNYSTKY